MVTRLSGILEEINGTSIVVSTGASGLAYEVLIPAYLAARLRAAHALDVAETGRTIASLNVPISLHTLEYFEGQGQGTSFIPRLLGFASVAERQFFDLFTTVKGLGNRRALRALAAEPASIVDAIVSRDARRLQELPEIGKKLAETIILELRDKAERFVGMLGGAPRSARGDVGGDDIREHKLSPAAMEALSAIMTLGENESNAERMIMTALRRNPALATADEIVSAAYSGG